MHSDRWYQQHVVSASSCVSCHVCCHGQTTLFKLMLRRWHLLPKHMIWKVEFAVCLWKFLMYNKCAEIEMLICSLRPGVINGYATILEYKYLIDQTASTNGWTDRSTRHKKTKNEWQHSYTKQLKQRIHYTIKREKTTIESLNNFEKRKGDYKEIITIKKTLNN